MCITNNGATVDPSCPYEVIAGRLLNPMVMMHMRTCYANLLGRAYSIVEHRM